MFHNILDFLKQSSGIPKCGSLLRNSSSEVLGLSCKILEEFVQLKNSIITVKWSVLSHKTLSRIKKYHVGLCLLSGV